MAASQKLEKLILILLGFSLVSIAVYQMFPRQIVLSTKNQDWQSCVSVDRLRGADSVVENVSSDDQNIFRYRLSPAAQYARASMFFFPKQNVGRVEDADGKTPDLMSPLNSALLMDMSWVDKVQIVGKIDGKPIETFRFYYRTFDRNILNPQGEPTKRYTQGLFTLTQRQQMVEIKRQAFHVPAWWITRRGIDLSTYGQPTFKNVEWLGVSPIADGSDQPVTVTIDSITLQGYWIPTAVFYSMVLGMWLLFAIGVLLHSLQSSRNEARHFRNRAHKDHLTGLLNRRGVNETMQSLTSFRSSEDFALSLVMMDIDFFKQLNDSRGHNHGDRVLESIGRLIKDASDKYGLTPIRWGGEEFLVIAPSYRMDQASRFAEELRQMVKSQTTVTGSFGVYEMQHDELLLEGIDKADQALYNAKQRGRDQVSVFGPDAQTESANRISEQDG